MGCIAATKSTTNNEEGEEGEEAEKESEQEQIDYTETYDPANMSVSRDSAMADYQFTGKKPKGSFKLKLDMARAHRLSTIKDDVENDHYKINNDNDDNDDELNAIDESAPIALPHKRVIFISIAQLNACIDDIPSYILTESIFCFKAQRSWFWPRTMTEHRDSHHSLRHKINFNNKFLNVLKQKDRNNLVLWLEDNKTWKDISKELTQIEDIYYKPVNHTATEDKIEPIEDTMIARHEADIRRYCALKLDTSWWLNDFENDTDRSMYCDSADTIVEELISAKLKFNPTMELLYQSNTSLIPMRGFDFEMYLNHHYAEKELNAQDTTASTTFRENYVRDIVPALTPFSPPVALRHNDVANMPSIDITDAPAVNNMISAHSNSNKINITPASSNRSMMTNVVKLTSNSSEPYEGSMVYIAQNHTKEDGADADIDIDRDDENRKRNPHQIGILNRESIEM